MRNLMIGILMKMSKMDEKAKELTAQVEAQSLLLGVLTLTQGKNGGVKSMNGDVDKAFMSALKSSESFLASDVDLVMKYYKQLISITRYVESSNDNDFTGD